MRNKTKCVLLAGLLAVLTLLGACGGTDDESGGVRDDVPVSDLASIAEAEISGSEGLIEPGDAYIAGAMKLEPSELGEYVIKISAYSTSINEYGIFKAETDEELEALVSDLNDYLTMRNDAWMSEYLPEEYPKLQNAQVRQKGLYCFYVILDSEEANAVFNAISAELEAD